MSPAEYLKAWSLYEANVLKGPYDSLMAVNQLQEYFWDDNGPLNYDASKNHTYSQDLPNFYKVTNSLNMRDRESILTHQYYTGPNPYKMKVSKLAGVDIDYPEDYEMAAALYPTYIKMIDSTLTPVETA